MPLRDDEWKRLGELEQLDDRARIIKALEAFHDGPREFWRTHVTALAMYQILLEVGMNPSMMSQAELDEEMYALQASGGDDSERFQRLQEEQDRREQ
jgi:hypothetical protein